MDKQKAKGVRMKTGDEKTIVAVPKVFYHTINPELKPTGRQIADYQCKVRNKPGRKTN